MTWHLKAPALLVSLVWACCAGSSQAEPAPPEVRVQLEQDGRSTALLRAPRGVLRLSFSTARGVASVLRGLPDGGWLTPRGVLSADGRRWLQLSPPGWVALGSQGHWQATYQTQRWRARGQTCQWPSLPGTEAPSPPARLTQWVAQGRADQLLMLQPLRDDPSGPMKAWMVQPGSCRLEALPDAPGAGFAGLLVGGEVGWLLTDPEALQLSISMDGRRWETLPLPEGTHQWLGTQWARAPDGQHEAHVAVSRSDLDFGVAVYRWEPALAQWVRLERTDWPAGLTLHTLP